MEGESPTPFFTTCDYCDEPFEPETSYPVLTDRDDGDVELYSFCDVSCLTAWEEAVTRSDDGPQDDPSGG